VFRHSNLDPRAPISDVELLGAGRKREGAQEEIASGQTPEHEAVPARRGRQSDALPGGTGIASAIQAGGEHGTWWSDQEISRVGRLRDHVKCGINPWGWRQMNRRWK
jgi:hypothetical protein